MGQAISNQHPAVVLRSHYNHMRTLLAIAMIAVTGLTVALVVVANDDSGTGTGAAVALPPAADTATPGDVRYDGGPEEGTRNLARSAPVAPANPDVRYDGGPEEGTRGPGN